MGRRDVDRAVPHQQLEHGSEHMGGQRAPGCVQVAISAVCHYCYVQLLSRWKLFLGRNSLIYYSNYQNYLLINIIEIM